MYIYDLPFAINKELCRLLDIDDVWKTLAGKWMGYTMLDIMEIEQESIRQKVSPTSQLLVRWGQQNHTVNELFMLLHRMPHVPAKFLLKPVIIDARAQSKLKKHNGVRGPETASIEENDNKHKMQRVGASDCSIPLPVMLIEKGEQRVSSIKQLNLLPTKEDTTTDSEASSSVTCGSNTELMRQVSAVPRLRYEELRRATDNWSRDKLLGKGGFGQVYKGEWKLLPVAVKRLKGNDERNRELIREMSLNQYRHDNILPLYGYSCDGPEVLLVHQLMTGGSLEQRLRRRGLHAPLTWLQRYRIAHGVARGLQYLHTLSQPPLIHGDIKPANILLDPCGVPRIGDFGLARKGASADDDTHLIVSKVYGTKPYLPPEYRVGGVLSAAVDVFSFGVLLLEVASALRVLLPRAAGPGAGAGTVTLQEHVRGLCKQRVDLASIEDPELRGSAGSQPALCRQVVALGAACTAESLRERPAMLQVYQALENMTFPGREGLELV